MILIRVRIGSTDYWSGIQTLQYDNVSKAFAASCAKHVREFTRRELKNRRTYTASILNEWTPAKRAAHNADGFVL